MEFDILTAAAESYWSDLWIWVAGFIFLLGCSTAMGIFVYRRARARGVRLRSATVYLAAIVFVTLFAGAGLCMQYHLLTRDLALWRGWIESADYAEAQGTVGDVVCTQTRLIESFAFDGRVFRMSENPYLQGRHDLLSDGKTLVVRHRDGLVLQIDAGNDRGS